MTYNGLKVDWFPGPGGTWPFDTDWSMSGRTMNILLNMKKKDILAKIDSIVDYPRPPFSIWPDTLTTDDITPMFEVMPTGLPDSLILGITNSGDHLDIYPSSNKMIIKEIMFYEPVFPCK